VVDKKFDSYDHFTIFSSVSCFVVPARAWLLLEMPVLANLINADLSRGFTVAQLAEKHGWTEPMVWSLALEDKNDLERFIIQAPFSAQGFSAFFVSAMQKLRIL